MKLTQRGASRTRDLVKKENGEQFILFIFLKKVFFGSGPFLESLLNLLHHCFCFTFWFLGHEACRTSGPRAGVESTPPAPEGEVLTTRNQGCPGGRFRLLPLVTCKPVEAQPVLKHRWFCITLTHVGHAKSMMPLATCTSCRGNRLFGCVSTASVDHATEGKEQLLTIRLGVSIYSHILIFSGKTQRVHVLG